MSINQIKGRFELLELCGDIDERPDHVRQCAPFPIKAQPDWLSLHFASPAILVRTHAPGGAT